MNGWVDLVGLVDRYFVICGGNQKFDCWVNKKREES